MTTLDTRIRDEAIKAGERLGLPARFLAAWWVSENGWTWPGTNNVGNISYTGEGVPTGGVFAGVTRVESNRVCVYATPDEGMNAFVLLLETPKAHKALTIDIGDLRATEDVREMTQKVGASNWAESHYDDGNGPGSLIWAVYNSPGLAEAFATAHESSSAAELHREQPKPTRPTIRVVEGDTLTKLADRTRTTVRAFAVLNDLADPNLIEVGQELKVPVAYQVKPGDTVSALAAKFGTDVEDIAKANSINPDRIYTGELLFV